VSKVPDVTTVKDANLSSRFESTATMSWIAVLCLLGALLRLIHYVGDRSLWLDEAMLALNIRERSFAGLLKPLDQDQMAPPGFLYTVKILTQVIGETEYGFRLASLLAGLFALALFAPLASRTLSIKARVVAVALFALSPFLIYYSSELKQYGFDSAATILLLLLARLWLDSGTRRGLIALTIAGTLVSWFSHPSVFVLAAIGSVAIVSAARQRRWDRAAVLSGICALWMVSFGTNLLLTNALNGPVTAHMQGIYWRDAFLPVPPQSFGDLVWPVKALLSAFVDPGGFKLPGLAVFLGFAGCVASWRRDPAWTAIIVLPVGIALLASGIKLYPFGGRFLLFSVPLFILLIASGFDSVTSLVGRSNRTVSIGLALLLFLSPLLTLARDLSVRPPFAKMEIKQALDYVAHSAAPNDTLYIYFGAEYAFKFYAPRYDFRGAEVIFGKAPRLTVKDPNGSWDQYLDDIAALKGRGRVWIILAGQKAGEEASGMDQERFLIYFADRIGHRLDYFKGSAESAAYLYDFGTEVSPVSKSVGD
jgi:hypothetical protein